MASEVKDSTNVSPKSSYTSGNGNNDAGDFECNICFELAQDPVVTLCGHLYCWPCLFRWLRLHSQSHECPLCKALIQEEKLIPLYGRGKTPSDPRSKPIPGFEIPNRPAGQRPETAPASDPSPAGNFPNFSFGLLGGFIPIATASFGNVGMSAGFGGFTMPSSINLQFNGFPNVNAHGASPGFAHGNHVNRTGMTSEEAQADNNLKMLLLCIGFAVLYFLVCT